jgi:hypothetical protein
VIISNIKAKGPDDSLRDLGALSFMLNWFNLVDYEKNNICYNCNANCVIFNG